MSFNISGENTNEVVNNKSLIINSKGDVKDVFTGEITPARTANNSLIVNGNGDVKDVSTGEVTPSKPTEEEPFVSSQNEVDLTKYNESLYPPEGSIPERLANGQNTQSFIVATEKDSPTPTRENRATEAPSTGGQKRVIKQNYWDNPEKIKQHFNSFEEAMNDKDAERYNRFQETGENQGEEMSITDGSKWAIPTQQNTPKIPQPEVRDLHQEALDSNAKANEGFQPLRQSDGFKNFVDAQEEAERKATAHQEALDSNAKANEGFDPSLQSDGYMNWRKSLEDQEKQETTPVQPEEGTNLGDIDSRLEEMNIHLSEINQNIQKLLEDREISSLTPEQLLEYITLLQEQNRIQAEINQTTINKILATIENNNNISISNTNETNVNMPPIQQTPPEPPEPPRPPITIPEPITAESDRVAQLEDQLRELRGQNTPEQRSMALGKRLIELESKLANGGLTDAEKIEYFDIMNQKREIDKQINAAQEESERKRKKKEKWIKIAAGVVGVGVALATPAIGCAAVLGVTLGGRIVGKGLQSLSTKLRTKSNAIKYEPREGKTLEQLNEMDRKQKRNAWWANRLGEASAVLIGGATGYGLGNLFEGIVGKDFYIGMNNQPTPQIPTGAEPQTPAEPQAPEAPQVEQPTTTTTPEIPTSEIPVSTDWIPGETFNASDFGWDYNQMGWLGDKVYLTNAGGNSGILQGNFFTELSKLVPKDVLMGQNSGNIVNQFLRSAYGGMNPTEAAGKAAELLLGK
ncbi:MAG TPA: hypothetical protein P5059_01820 [Candidatus Dojkabacteria bacterium]|nr:hypothetical protein [Candidatus Dojkabacteria bacterium]